MRRNATHYAFARSKAETSSEAINEGNPFEKLSDAKALEAAAKLIETAAYNLSVRISAEEASELIMMAAKLENLIERLGRRVDGQRVASITSN